MNDASKVFDLWDIFVNELIGDINLAIILGLLLLWVYGMKKGFDWEILLGLSGVFLSAMFAGAGSGLLYIWIPLVGGVGILFFYTMAKKVKQL